MDRPDHRIKAVLFDLDGVLVDAPEWHEEAFNRALVRYGEKPITKDDHLKNFNGLSTFKKLEILAERGIFDPSASIFFYNDKQLITEEIIKERCGPITRVIDTVTYANSLFNNNTAVVTNCSRATTESMLKKSKLFDKFKVIVTNEDVDGKIKPHPRPYLKAQSMLGINNPNKDCLAIDDTYKGIMSAIDARCRTWKLESFEDLSVMNLMKVLSRYRITI